MSQPARAVGQIWQSNASQRKYTITSANGSNWNLERDDGMPFLLTDAWFDKSATLVGSVAVNTPAPASSATQPVVQPPKYWVGQKVTSTNTGRTYTIHAYDSAKQEYTLIKANGSVVPGYSVQALDMYTTIDPGQTPPTANAATVPVVVSPYKIGDRFKGASSGTIYTIKSQIGPTEWRLKRDNGNEVDFYDSDIAMLIPISTSQASTSGQKDEQKKPCCSIGALKAEEGKPCPLHKPAKPKYDFSDLVSEWDLLPDAKPEKEKKQ